MNKKRSTRKEERNEDMFICQTEGGFVAYPKVIEKKIQRKRMDIIEDIILKIMGVTLLAIFIPIGLLSIYLLILSIKSIL